MAKTTYLGLETIDFLGLDSGKKLANGFLALAGVSPESNMNKIDKAFELQKSEMEVLKQKENIQAINAVLSSSSSNLDFYTAAVDGMEKYKDQSILLLSFSENNKQKTQININEIGIVDLKKINSNSEIVDLESNDIKKNINYLYKMNIDNSSAVEKRELVLIGEDINGQFNKINLYINDILSKLKKDIDLKAPIDSPSFTGDVKGITNNMIGLGNVTNDAQVKRDEMGIANGVATLDENGKLSESQNPTYNQITIDHKLDLKVDKIEGKGLSSNDYTNEEKDKLAKLNRWTGAKAEYDILPDEKKNDDTITFIITDDDDSEDISQILFDIEDLKTNKIDKKHVDEKLTLKADKNYVDNKVSKIDADLAEQKTYFDTELKKKSDIKSFIDGNAEGSLRGINTKSDYQMGENAVAEGYNTETIGKCSHAEGKNTIASGDYSHAEGQDTIASRYMSHAEGFATKASGYSSHAEGNNTKASGDNSHAEGKNTIASSDYSHAEGQDTIASMHMSHAEGFATKASGYGSHAEGCESISEGYGTHAGGLGCYVGKTYCGVATGSGSISTPIETVLPISKINKNQVFIDTSEKNISKSDIDKTLKGFSVENELLFLNEYYYLPAFIKRKIQNTNLKEYIITLDEDLPTENFRCRWLINSSIEFNATNGSFANGVGCVSLGYTSYAEGNRTTASGNGGSHAEGQYTIASGNSSHAEGYNTTASGNYGSHAEGQGTIASGNRSHTEGQDTTASGDCSHAEGYNTTASGDCSHAEGQGTIADTYLLHSQGRYNKKSAGTPSSYSPSNNAFIIGNGTNKNNLSNCFRVDFSGNTYGVGAFNSSGADYAESFEWLDGNPQNEDRVGLFVTLDGEKIRIAQPTDDYILGVVSATPSVLGDSYDDQWQGQYLTDEFGRFLTEQKERKEKVIVGYKTVKNKKQIQENKENYIDYVDTKEPIYEEKTYIDTVFKLNPDYNPNKKYVPRSKRKEWSPVGVVGKLIVYDNGKCLPNNYCTVGKNGIAIPSSNGYRVLSRINDNLIKIWIR